jgi:hypothetical protein
VHSFETLVGFSFCPCRGNATESCLFAAWHVYPGTDDADTLVTQAREDAAVVYPTDDTAAKLWDTDDTSVWVGRWLGNIGLLVAAASDDVCDGFSIADAAASAARTEKNALRVATEIALLQTPEGREVGLDGLAKLIPAAAGPVTAIAPPAGRN